MFTLWSDIDRLFNHSFADWRRGGEAADSNMRMNVMDQGDNLEFVAELPGVSEADLSLTVHDDTLTVGAKRVIDHGEADRVYLAERSSFDVQRSVALPVRVDADRTTATFKNGVLRVVLPKAAENKPKRIAINA